MEQIRVFLGNIQKKHGSVNSGLLFLLVLRGTAVSYTHLNRKFTLAPCQIPVKSHTTRMSRTWRRPPFRLPPRGMYTYSLNQVPREICHRRQNSVILFEIYG